MTTTGWLIVGFLMAEAVGTVRPVLNEEAPVERMPADANPSGGW